MRRVDQELIKTLIKVHHKTLFVRWAGGSTSKRKRVVLDVVSRHILQAITALQGVVKKGMK